MTEQPNIFENVRQRMDELSRIAHEPAAELKLTAEEWEQVQAALKTHPSSLMQIRPDEPLGTAGYLIGRPIVIVDKDEDSSLWPAKQQRRLFARFTMQNPPEIGMPRLEPPR